MGKFLQHEERSAPRSSYCLHEVEPGTAQQSIAIVSPFVAEFDVCVMDRALIAFAMRTAALGGPVPAHDDERVRWIAGKERAWLREEDASDADDAGLSEWLARAAHEPFNPVRGPLLRIHLFRRGIRANVVLLVAHHFIADVWSATGLIRELETLYSEHKGGVSAPPPMLMDFVRCYSWVNGTRVSGCATLSADKCQTALRRLREMSFKTAGYLPVGVHQNLSGGALPDLPDTIGPRPARTPPAECAADVSSARPAAQVAESYTARSSMACVSCAITRYAVASHPNSELQPLRYQRSHTDACRAATLNR